MNKRELWLNLANYHFDHLAPTTVWNEIKAKFAGESPFTLAFADKLSRKLHWKKNFALKAIWEYKKFVFLGITSPLRVTPSKVIDQVWHEHLLFSAGYRQFCKEVILKDFDHHPELAEIDSQTVAFQEQYSATIELYKKEFGIDPPADIWGVTKFPEKEKKEDEKNKWVTDPGTSGDAGCLYSQLSSGEYSELMYGGGDFGGGGAGSGFEEGSNDDSGGDADGGSDGGTSCSSSCGSGCGGGD